MSNELLPCPTCGCTKIDYELEEDFLERKSSHRFRCSGCGFDGGFKDTREQAAKLWNGYVRPSDFEEVKK